MAGRAQSFHSPLGPCIATTAAVVVCAGRRFPIRMGALAYPGFAWKNFGPVGGRRGRCLQLCSRSRILARAWLLRGKVTTAYPTRSLARALPGAGASPRAGVYLYSSAGLAGARRGRADPCPAPCPWPKSAPCAYEILAAYMSGPPT